MVCVGTLQKTVNVVFKRVVGDEKVNVIIFGSRDLKGKAFFSHTLASGK